MNIKYMQDDFYEYMNGRLKYRKIALKDVCEGIIDTDKLYKYMSQQRSLSKLVSDRLLDRMGGSDYDYEYYLLPDEYKLWEKRQKLVRSILLGEPCEELTAAVLNTDDIYYVGDETEGRLSRQFALAMIVQAMKLHNAKQDNEEYKKILAEAVKLTVPDFDAVIAAIDRNILDSELTAVFNCKGGENVSSHKAIDNIYTTDRRLGCQELALILDLVGCGYFEKKLAMKLCLSFLKYIPAEFNEQAAVVSIYPKAVCTLCDICDSVGDNVHALMLEFINDAVEMLGLGMRTYYIWELLEYRERYTGRKDELKSAIEYIHGLVNIEVRTLTDAYLYIETEVFDAATVIDVRRRMLGMTKKDLCRDLCTEMTLLSFINKKRNPHLHTARILFDRLKMGTQLIRAEIVSGKYEDRMNSREIRKLSARGQYEKADELNKLLMSRLDMDCIENIRALNVHSIWYSYKRGEINKEQHRENYRKLLEYTVDVVKMEEKASKAIGNRAIFLTGDELICLYNMYRLDGNKEEHQWLIDLCNFYERNFDNDDNMIPLIINHANRYALLMNHVSAYYGKTGEHEQSEKIGIDLIRNMLIMRRMNYIAGNVYGLWWNKTEQYGYDKTSMEEKRKLNVCINLYHWMQKYNYEKKYREEMDKYY